MDANSLANQLIEAIKKQSQQGLVSLEQTRKNDFMGIMNRANARGSLYSTQPQTLKTQYNANTYMPKKTALEQAPLTQEISIRSGLVDTQREIDTMMRSATELNNLKFDQYGEIV